MKKLIVLSVVFALVAVAAFAVDLGGTVIGTVNLFESNTGDDAKINSSAVLNRVRVDGGGETGEGKFGGYVRVDMFHTIADPADLNGKPWEAGGQVRFMTAAGNAWWKPIDQFKLMFGSNGGDGFYGKDGVTAWMFYQTVSDTGIVKVGNAWGGGYGEINFRDIFYGGDGGGDALRMEIRPLDILGININIPFFNGIAMYGDLEQKETADVFKKTMVQLDLNLDFGNIALTYRGGLGADDDNDDPAKIFLYYGGSFGDLAIDFGFSYQMDGKEAGVSYKNPMGVGLGVKYASDAFGVKLRVGATLAGEDKATNILADVLPYFSLGDNLTAFVSVGIAMFTPDQGDGYMAWHFNPYLQVGEEWGAKFLVGVKVDGSDKKGDDGKDAPVNWSVPIALSVSF
jgi:hypothetical protein